MLATRVGGVPEVVEHGATGGLIEPGSAEAAAPAVERMLTDTPNGRGMGERGRRRAVARFEPQQSVGAVASLLLLLGSDSRGGLQRIGQRPFAVGAPGE